MFEIVRYTRENAAEWDSFVAESKNGTFLLSRPYMDYHADRFSDCSLMFRLDGRLYALLPACRQGDSIVSHGGLTYGGLIINHHATAERVAVLFDELNSYLSRCGIGEVIYKAIPHIYHRIPAEEDLYALFKVCHAELLSRDIASAIRLRSPLRWRKDRRYRLKKAYEAGITVEQSGDIDGFYRILDGNLSATYGVHPVHSLPEIKLLMSRFPRNIALYAASLDGRMLAGTILYLTPCCAHAQYISASPEGKALSAVDAIYDVLLHTELSSYRYFDFGKSTEQGGRYLNASLIQQKEGFGARAVCYDTYRWDIKPPLNLPL